SEKLYRETIEQERVVFGPEHKNTLMGASNLAEILTNEKKYAEAEALQRDTLAIQRRILGPDHQDVAETIYGLAALAAMQQRRDQALSLLQEAVTHNLSHDTRSRLDQDSRFASLHGDARFTAIVARAHLVPPKAE